MEKTEFFEEPTNTDKLNHPLVAYIELLGLYIKSNTSYRIEISFINNDYEAFFQIDEFYNKFYFSFYSDRIEFAFGDFDNYETILWNTLPSIDITNLVSKMENMGAPESLVKSFQLFLISSISFLKNYI